MPALLVSSSALRAEVDAVLPILQGTSSLVVETRGCVLRLQRGNRVWHVDDGVIDEQDRAIGGHVANLPGGAVYTTVLEDETEGELFLERAGPARDVRFRFERGRVVDVEAREGGAKLASLFDTADGETRRISHVGIGLNPQLHHPIGSVLVDEHVHGALIVAFGENRYLGGENASSLNVDFCSAAATIRAAGNTVVKRGVLTRYASADGV